MSQLSNFAFADPFSPQPVAARQPSPIPPITEAEKQSLLAQIGSAGLGGLSYIAGALNKPGRVIRGLLGGQPREALNIVPFSDALGLTDPSQEVHGSQINANLGLTDNPHPDFFTPQGIAGFATDVLTDPLTYMSFGGHALTELGEAAKAAHVLPGSVGERLAGVTGEAAEKLAEATGRPLAEVAGQKLGGHVGLGVPFMGNNIGTYDLGPLANAAGSAVRALPGGNALLNAGSAVGGAVSDLYNRTIPPLFQKSVMGQTEPALQDVARGVSAGIPEVQAAARREVMGVGDLLPEISQEGGRQFRQALETPTSPTGELAPAVTAQRELQGRNLSTLNAAGFPDQPLNDPAIAYAERHNTLFNPEQAAQFGQSMKPTGQMPGREELFKGVPTEGPGSLNDLTRRADILPEREAYLNGDTQPLIDRVKKDYIKLPKDELTDLRNQNSTIGLPDSGRERLAELEAKSKQAENLADWTARSVPQQLAEAGLGAFDRHPLVDLEEGNVRAATRVLKAQGIHKAVASVAERGGEGVPLNEVLNAAGLTYKDANGVQTAMSRTLEQMQAMGKIGPNATLDDLRHFKVPEQFVPGITRFTKAATSPAGLAPFLKIWDSVTNLTKAFQTTLWPANIVRNQGQALFQNWIHDGYNALESGPMKWVRPMIDANDWRLGNTIKGANQYPGLTHLTEKAASDTLKREIASFRLDSAYKNPANDIIGTDLATRQLLPSINEPRPALGDILKSAIPTTKSEANPLNIAGFGGRTEDAFAPVAAGRNLNKELHAMDRVATYLAKRSQGFAPEAALADTKLAHYDFANMSDFEKNVMRRVIPFYNFTRQNVPAVIKELAENPGGKLANVVRGAAAAKGQEPGFIPGYIGEGIATPIGEEQNGTQRYLTRLGLGFEDLGALTGPGGPLGTLNPLIKAPIEQATGKQLFTGRDLADLHSRLGDLTGTPLPLAENIAMNSPIGRAMSTVGTFADPRKSILDKLLNTATGIRLTDANVESARRRAVQDYITNNLLNSGVQHFDTLSVRPDQYQNLSPFEQNLYRLYRSQQGRSPAPLTLTP